VVFFSWTLANAGENNDTRVRKFLMPPYYFSNADAGALRFLRDVPDKNAAVLCLPILGSYVPRATGLFTFVGHWAETLDKDRKLGEEARFYRGQMAPNQARAFLKNNGIRYIIESPFERALAPNSSTARALRYKAIYSSNTPDVGDTTIYEVTG